MIIKEYVKETKEALRQEILTFKRKPRFTIIQLNEDAGSNAYVKGKLKDSEEIGVDANLIKLPIDTTEEDLLKLIDQINKDPLIDALIVQMPLPKQIDEEKIKLAVAPEKDVDGFHPMSKFVPCTPKGVIDYLKSENVEFVGKNAVVLGRSNIVGKPAAHLLLKESCNVTVLHSKTSKEDMARYLKNADIIVLAIGKKWFLKDQELKPTAVIADVGINRDEDGLHGDAYPNLPVKLQTPVPGGVGLLTRVTLMVNVVEAYKNRNEK